MCEHAPERRAARVARAQGGRAPGGAGMYDFFYSVWDQFASAPGWFKRYIVGTGESPQQAGTRMDTRAFGSAQAPRGRTLNDNGPRAEGSGSGYNWGQGNRLGTE